MDLEVDQLEVRNGQTLTVWLNPIEPHEQWDGDFSRAQVELRVNNGSFQVFVDRSVLVHTFDMWEPIKNEF